MGIPVFYLREISIIWNLLQISTMDIFFFWGGEGIQSIYAIAASLSSEFLTPHRQLQNSHWFLWSMNREPTRADPISIPSVISPDTVPVSDWWSRLGSFNVVLVPWIVRTRESIGSRGLNSFRVCSDSQQSQHKSS